jgi:hypothetical protein
MFSRGEVVTEQKEPVVEDDRPVADLIRMHMFCRPHGSRTEQSFVEEYLLPLKPDLVDEKGNIIKIIPGSDVLWSSHTDTIHTKGGMQRLRISSGRWLSVHKKSLKRGSNCLGADDTVGVWLMREMALAGKPGIYIFHRGEEQGCIGSRHIAATNKDLLKKANIAIALDRKGTSSIITHQSPGRCCSDAFGKSLAEQLGDGFKLDDGGIYTDTAHYIDDIGECTNLSVGYVGAHTGNEAQDLIFAITLKDKLLGLDVSKLTVERKPGEKEARTYSYYGGGRYTSWSKDRRTWLDEYYGWEGAPYGARESGYYKNGVWHPTKYEGIVTTSNCETWKPKGNSVVPFVPVKETDAVQDVLFDKEDERPKTIFELVADYPDEVADILEHLGYDPNTLASDIADRR